MIITIDVSDILSLPVTNTTAGVSAGSSVSTALINSNGFAANDFAVVGVLGDEGSELQTISSVTNTTTLVFGALSFNHPSGTYVQKVLYDQIKVERSADNSSWSVITTISIKGDQRKIDYNDTAGTSTSYYRFRYYNSTTATYGGYSNSISLSAPSAVDIIIDEVIGELGTEYDDTINRNIIFNALADTDLKISRELVRTNKEILKSSTTANIVAGTQDYAMPANFVKITQVLVAYTANATQKESKEIELEYGDNTNTFADFYHSVYRKASDGLTYIKLRKTTTENVTSGLTVHAVIRPTRILKTTDTLLIPQPLLYLDVYKAGVKEIIYRDFRNDLPKSQLYGQIFMDGLADIRMITNDVDGSDGATIVSDELSYVFNS